VGAGVAVFVDRLDFDFAHRDLAARAGEQDVHLIFVAVAVDAEQKRDETHAEGPQAGLGVADLHAGRETVDEAGEPVAEAAAARDVFAVEAAAAEHQCAGVRRGFVGGADRVRDGVLAVRVERDDDGAGRAVAGDIGKTGAERAALAAVLLVGQNNGEALGRRENAAVLLAAAVVHKDDAEVCVTELHNEIDESVIRLIGRDQRGALDFCQHGKPSFQGRKLCVSASMTVLNRRYLKSA